MYGEMSFYEKDMDICTLYDDDEPDPDEERDTFFDCPMEEGLFLPHCSIIYTQCVCGCVEK